ncbi:hypothetical protein [Silvibacterium dinghuense]|uniref:Uncharacterized protein n=1 Tax=Silvibacterium dinghuense TaxID=1560006 RepID=A0A4Q1SID0_9BACT|nr:hypothetical protein [Silvibacterium dinghuense]RXS97139.1 hypothetical protein ESZ00_04265 [Silvibacterium dinghuense]GGG96552.1 hypothetical protein GCM10011586_09660 [Silvibacterium dinghuense]
MSVVEEVRQVFQDLLAPELRAVAERVSSLEKRLDDNRDVLGQWIDETRTVLGQRIEDTRASLEQRISAIEQKVLAVDLRIDTLEYTLTQRMDRHSESLKHAIQLSQELVLDKITGLRDALDLD